MAAKFKKEIIDIDADIADFVAIQAMADVKARLATDQRIKKEATLSHLNAMASLIRYINDGGFLSINGFFCDIDDEYKAFLTAAIALRAKVMKVSVLYLDAQGMPFKDEGTWSSYHSIDE